MYKRAITFYLLGQDMWHHKHRQTFQLSVLFLSASCSTEYSKPHRFIKFNLSFCRQLCFLNLRIWLIWCSFIFLTNLKSKIAKHTIKALSEQNSITELNQWCIHNPSICQDSYFSINNICPANEMTWWHGFYLCSNSFWTTVKLNSADISYMRLHSSNSMFLVFSCNLLITVKG